MQRLRVLALILLIITTTVYLIGCGNFDSSKVEQLPEAETQRFSDTYFDVFDTATTLLAYSENQETFDELTGLVHQELMEYHKLFDIYNTYEGINNAKTINDMAGIEAVSVDPEIIELIQLGKELYEETDGRINIAMGAVLTLWHNARTAAESNPDDAYIPEIADLKAAADHCNIHDIIIDKDAGTVFLKDPEMSIDLGAIGKGYATERVAAKIEAKGYTNFVISAGGNVRASGIKNDGTAWVIGIQNPELESEDAYIDTIELSNSSVVTSGIYQRYFEINGERYHHIIDSETLMPENRFLSLSISTADSGYADALSTAVFNMELEEGQAFIESLEGVEALWILPDQTLVPSSGWKAMRLS